MRLRGTLYADCASGHEIDMIGKKTHSSANASNAIEVVNRFETRIQEFAEWRRRVAVQDVFTGLRFPVLAHLPLSEYKEFSRKNLCLSDSNTVLS